MARWATGECLRSLLAAGSAPLAKRTNFSPEPLKSGHSTRNSRGGHLAPPWSNSTPGTPGARSLENEWLA